VPHAQSIDQKNERALYSTVVLTGLLKQRASSFQWIIIGNDACFFLYCPRDSIWAVSRDEFPQRTKQKSDTEK
jgi:hypothetical protein